jgi:ABC-type transport system involved in multi-copper enzyme maturation permease subunit
MATAGKILGIIGCVLLALGIIYLIVVIIVAVSDNS